MFHWDAAKMADLVEREAKIRTALAEVTDKLNNAYADETLKTDDSKLKTYDADNLRHGQLCRELTAVRDEISTLGLLKPEQVKSRNESPLARFLQGGHSSLEEAERKEFCQGLIEDSDGEGFIIRGEATASDVTDGGGGGRNATDIETRPSVIDELKFFGGLEKMIYQFDTANGNELRHPQHDDSKKKGRILGAQRMAIAPEDLNDFETLAFYARTGTSDSIRITREMLQDGIFDVASFAEARAVRRLGRAWDEELTIGGTAIAGLANGAFPEGIVSVNQGAQEGHVTVGANAVIYEDLIELIYSVPRAYRVGSEMGMGGLMAQTGGRIGFLISDGAEKAVRLLKDDDGRPLWQPSINGIDMPGMGNMLVGYPYEVSGSLEGTLADNETNSIMFGNFSYYGKRNVRAIEIFRMQDSRTMQNNMIEIVAFNRCFGRPMVLGPKPAGNAKWKGIEQIKKLKIKSK